MNSLGKIYLYTLIGNDDMQHNLENHKFVYGYSFSNYKNCYDTFVNESTFYANQTDYDKKEWRKQARLSSMDGVTWPKDPSQN